jgi:hypothetical protein
MFSDTRYEYVISQARVFFVMPDGRRIGSDVREIWVTSGGGRSSSFDHAADFYMDEPIPCSGPYNWQFIPVSGLKAVLR